MGSKTVPRDDKRYSWTRRIEDYAKRHMNIDYVPDSVVVGCYRPFCKQWVYYERTMNERTYQQPRFFPLAAGERAKGPTSNPNAASLTEVTAEAGMKGKSGRNDLPAMSPHCLTNLEICMTGPASGREFSCLISAQVPDLHMQSTSQCFPLYWYDEPSGDGLLGRSEPVRHDAITDESLAVFQETYGDTSITKEDIFFYVYGLLHSPEYRKRFANNLKKELPRIPLAKDFRAFEQAGRKLGELHVNYESVEPWPVEEVGCSENPGRTEKMAWGKVRDKETGKLVKDLTVLKVSDNLTLRGIPERAQDYVVNGKSALAWLVDRYKVTTDKKSGIVNDPNLYAPDNPRYIVDLVESVIRVSMETLDVMDSLPPLEELPHPDNWPAAWSMDIE